MGDKSTLLFRGLMALCVGLAIAEFAIYRKAYFALEATPLFFALFGSVSLAVALICARLLAALVTRPADYYDADRQGEMQEDSNA